MQLIRRECFWLCALAPAAARPQSMPPAPENKLMTW
jgi:hypothetical protein